MDFKDKKVIRHKLPPLTATPSSLRQSTRCRPDAVCAVLQESHAARHAPASHRANRRRRGRAPASARSPVLLFNDGVEDGHWENDE